MVSWSDEEENNTILVLFFPPEYFNVIPYLS